VPTLVYILLATLVALVTTDLGVIVDVSGSLGASTIGFIAPAFIYMRIFPNERVGWWVALALLGIGVVVVTWGVGQIVAGMMVSS